MKLMVTDTFPCLLLLKPQLQLLSQLSKFHKKVHVSCYVIILCMSMGIDSLGIDLNKEV